MKMLAFFFACSLMSLGTIMCQTTISSTVRPVLADLEAELTKRGGFTQFLNLLAPAGLLDKLKDAANITVFAPTDAALARLPGNQLPSLLNDPNKLQKILEYHALLEDVHLLNRRINRRLDDTVITSLNDLPIRIGIYYLPHTVITVEGVEITERSIPISNGYVHALGGIMTPPEGDVVDILTADGGFTTFLSLVTAANLVDYIKTDMNITVFAPNDLAFANFDPKIITFLLSNPRDLYDLLRYHMLKTRTVYSIGMRHTFAFLSADTRHDKIMVFENFATGELKINTATIVQRDISATNGVIHVIDEVLIPARVLLNVEGSGIIIG